MKFREKQKCGSAYVVSSLPESAVCQPSPSLSHLPGCARATWWPQRADASHGMLRLRNHSSGSIFRHGTGKVQEENITVFLPPKALVHHSLWQRPPVAEEDPVKETLLSNMVGVDIAAKSRVKCPFRTLPIFCKTSEILPSASLPASHHAVKSQESCPRHSLTGCPLSTCIIPWFYIRGNVSLWGMRPERKGSGEKGI